MATATTADTFQTLICSRIFVSVTDLAGRLPVAPGADEASAGKHLTTVGDGS